MALNNGAHRIVSERPLQAVYDLKEAFICLRMRYTLSAIQRQVDDDDVIIRPTNVKPAKRLSIHCAVGSCSDVENNTATSVGSLLILYQRHRPAKKHRIKLSPSNVHGHSLLVLDESQMSHLATVVHRAESFQLADL